MSWKCLYIENYFGVKDAVNAFYFNKSKELFVIEIDKKQYSFSSAQQELKNLFLKMFDEKQNLQGLPLLFNIIDTTLFLSATIDCSQSGHIKNDLNYEDKTDFNLLIDWFFGIEYLNIPFFQFPHTELTF